MTPYQHFGLVRPPFEPNPDPRVLYGSPTHGEALATLEYMVHANKSCAVVIGESGSGKTLLARLIAAKAGRRTGVLWVHGIGQPPDITEVSLFSPGALSAPTPEPAVEHTTLAQWTRAHNAWPDPPLLIIDDADDLPEHGWTDVIALLSREVEFPLPINVVLLGAPRLVNRLGSPELTRLRRRVFRTCVLGPLNEQQVGEYVACRLSAVGANRVQIFDSGAVAQIHRLTKGNPGLINQVCDNALLEAFSRGNKQVTAAEVLAAAHAIVGALHLLSHGTGVSLKLGGPPAAALSPPLSAAPAPHAGPSPVRVLAPAPSKTPAPAPALEPACAPQPAPAAPGGSPQRLARMTRAFDAYVGNVEQRLSFLETRLTTALSAVRNARLEHDGSRSPQTAPAAAPEKTDDAPGGGAVRRGRRLM